MVLGQLAVNLAKPWIDRLLYPEDREEIAWIQTLDRRLLTSSDLRQFLTNILISLCELLRVPNGFVIVQTDEGLRVEAVAGDSVMPVAYVGSPTAQEMWQRFAGDAAEAQTVVRTTVRLRTGYPRWRAGRSRQWSRATEGRGDTR